MIVAGYDERKGGSVYAIPAGGSLHQQPYAIGGSGSTYIYGYCQDKWVEGMDEEHAIQFVKGALGQAIRWDGSSGGVIRMVVVSSCLISTSATFRRPRSPFMLILKSFFIDRSPPRAASGTCICQTTATPVPANNKASTACLCCCSSSPFCSKGTVID